MTSSPLRAAGAPELVCTTAEEFVNRAVAFGNDPMLLQPIREKLRAGHDSCTLFDMPLLVRSLEGLYKQMWCEYEKGVLHQPDLANLDVYLEVGSQAKHDEIEVQTIQDYDGWWHEKLAQRHQFRPISSDRRLWQ